MGDCKCRFTHFESKHEVLTKLVQDTRSSKHSSKIEKKETFRKSVPDLRV